MEIALHMGAHLTDESQLRGCLRANQEGLAARGVLVPRARSYLNAITETANHVAADQPVSGFDARLLDAVEAGDDVTRLVMSAPGILARVSEIMNGHALYPAATARIAALRKMLGRHEVSLFFCIRNPATYVPAFLSRAKKSARSAVLEQLRSEELRWSPLIADMRLHWPEASVTVWCDEDTPFLWHQLLQQVAGCEPKGGFQNSYDWFDTVMVEGGAAKLEAYLTAQPPVDETHRQKVIAAFLDKFCDDDKLDVDIAITGWDDARVDVLTQLYENDVDLIGSMEGVRLLQP